MIAPERSDKDGIAHAVNLARLWNDLPDDFGPDHISMKGLKMLTGALLRLAATVPESGSSPTPRTDWEPTWGQLDATVRQHDLKTKSLMDTAELIWRLERELAYWRTAVEEAYDLARSEPQAEGGK